MNVWVTWSPLYHLLVFPAWPADLVSTVNWFWLPPQKSRVIKSSLSRNLEAPQSCWEFEVSWESIRFQLFWLVVLLASDMTIRRFSRGLRVWMLRKGCLYLDGCWFESLHRLGTSGNVCRNCWWFMLKNNMIRTWELMLTPCESVYRLYSRTFSSQQLSKRPKEVKSPSDLL